MASRGGGSSDVAAATPNCRALALAVRRWIRSFGLQDTGTSTNCAPDRGTWASAYDTPCPRRPPAPRPADCNENYLMNVSHLTDPAPIPAALLLCLVLVGGCASSECEGKASQHVLRTAIEENAGYLAMRAFAEDGFSISMARTLSRNQDGTHHRCVAMLTKHPTVGADAPMFSSARDTKQVNYTS